MPYRWEPTAGASGRYRDERGRFVASSTVRRELDRYLDNSDPAKALAEALRGRQLSVADWEIAMRRHIKNTHLNAIALERGGYANMTPADYGRVGQIVREQYAYLKNFGRQIANGEQKLDGTLGVRANLYTQAGRESFYRSKQANLQPGIDMVMSVRHARDSCAECIALEGKWFKVGDPAYKLPGQRICLKRCHCTERYGRMTADGVVALAEEPTTAAQAAIEWKPSMTVSEAEAWSANSSTPGPYYHVTNQAAVDPISNNGFRVDSVAFGRTWGDGVYMSNDRAWLADYEGPDTKTLELRANTQNPLVVDLANKRTKALNAEFAERYAGWQEAYSEVRETAFGWESAVYKTAKKLGFDSILVTGDDAQLIVFDPKRVTVVKR